MHYCLFLFSLSPLGLDLGTASALTAYLDFGFQFRRHGRQKEPSCIIQASARGCGQLMYRSQQTIYVYTKDY